jgi:hypothetical protein
VLVCAFDPPVAVVGDDAVAVGADVVVVGEVVVDVLLVCNVEEPPVDLVACDDDHLVEYALVVLPFV